MANAGDLASSHRGTIHPPSESRLNIREMTLTLQAYLNESRDVLLIDNVEMGAGLALHYSKTISALDRQECQ